MTIIMHTGPSMVMRDHPWHNLSDSDTEEALEDVLFDIEVLSEELLFEVRKAPTSFCQFDLGNHEQMTHAMFGTLRNIVTVVALTGNVGRPEVIIDGTSLATCLESIHDIVAMLREKLREGLLGFGGITKDDVEGSKVALWWSFVNVGDAYSMTKNMSKDDIVAMLNKRREEEA